jgi:hypothetical protein
MPPVNQMQQRLIASAWRSPNTWRTADCSSGSRLSKNPEVSSSRASHSHCHSPSRACTPWTWSIWSLATSRVSRCLKMMALGATTAGPTTTPRSSPAQAVDQRRLAHHPDELGAALLHAPITALDRRQRPIPGGPSGSTTSTAPEATAASASANPSIPPAALPVADHHECPTPEVPHGR